MSDDIYRILEISEPIDITDNTKKLFLQALMIFYILLFLQLIMILPSNMINKKFFLIALILCIFMLLIRNILRKILDSSRTIRFRKIAEKNSLSFKDTGDYLLDELFNFRLFSQELSFLRRAAHPRKLKYRRKIRNLIKKDISSIDLYIFDYINMIVHYYRERSGESSYLVRNKVTYEQTVILFRSKMFNLPNFYLRPKNWLEKKIKFSFTKIMKSIDHPIFKRYYLLKGNDAERIREIFNDNVLTYFENKKYKNIYVEGLNDKFICYINNSLIEPNYINIFIQDVLFLLNLWSNKNISIKLKI